MLKRQEAEAQAEALLRETRAGRRSKPLLNLLPIYLRMCPELRQFDEDQAFAIIKTANRAVFEHAGMNALFRISMGALIGYSFYWAPVLMSGAVPLALIGMGFDFWRVRRQVAITCAEMLPKALP